MANCKKISVDFHGVISAEPEFFGKLMRVWQKQEIKLYVVSGGPREYIEQYLTKYKIPYDELWCIFDYFNAREKVAVAADGSFHIDDEMWNRAKGDYCSREKIGLHIDDSAIYGKYFTTPYVRFDRKNKCFVFNGEVLATDESAEAVAQKLSTICSEP